MMAEGGDFMRESFSLIFNVAPANRGVLTPRVFRSKFRSFP